MIERIGERFDIYTRKGLPRWLVLLGIIIEYADQEKLVYLPSISPDQISINTHVLRSSNMSPISMHVVSAVSENDGSAPKANGYSVPAINESEGSTPRVNGYDAPTLNGNDSSIPTINGFHSNDTKTNGHLANAKLNGDIPVKPTQTPHEPIAIIGMGL